MASLSKAATVSLLDCSPFASGSEPKGPPELSRCTPLEHNNAVSAVYCVPLKSVAGIQLVGRLALSVTEPNGMPSRYFIARLASSGECISKNTKRLLSAVRILAMGLSNPFGCTLCNAALIV